MQYHPLTNDEHHAHHAIGASGLKLLQRSPLHYWARYLAPDREPDQPTQAMQIGTAWHCAVFEPDEFDARFVAIPEGLDRRTKEGKALYAEIEASGRTPFAAATVADIQAMANAARRHPEFMALCRMPHLTERSLFWHDADTGLACKIRPDFFIAPCAEFPGGVVLDGKSTTDASASEFGRQAFNLDYALQAAWYVDGFQAAHNTPEPPAFLWLAQEKERPYATAMYRAGDDLLEYGRRQYRPMLELLAECIKRNEWPGYPTSVEPLALPSWVKLGGEDEVEIVGYVEAAA